MVESNEDWVLLRNETDTINESITVFNSINESVITSSNIVNGTIHNEDLTDNSITSAKIANGTIQNEDLADNTITTDKIVDNSITMEKLAPSVQNEFTHLKRAMAMQASLTMATQSLKDKTLTLNLGYGTYSEYRAISTGLNFKISDNFAFKAAVSSDLDTQISTATGLSFGFNL